MLRGNFTFIHLFIRSYVYVFNHSLMYTSTLQSWIHPIIHSIDVANSQGEYVPRELYKFIHLFIRSYSHASFTHDCIHSFISLTLHMFQGTFLLIYHSSDPTAMHSSIPLKLLTHRRNMFQYDPNSSDTTKIHLFIPLTFLIYREYRFQYVLIHPIINSYPKAMHSSINEFIYSYIHPFKYISSPYPTFQSLIHPFIQKAEETVRVSKKWTRDGSNSIHPFFA